MSLPASYSYVSFMKVERASYLHIRFDYMYSIYIFFLIAIVVRYLWNLWHWLRGKDPEAVDITKVSSGL
jgi:TRAP-type C4-dicarboxylate transport system permease small subunit